MLNRGDAAPEFALPDQSGQVIALAALRGKRVVLFFFPKADTSGCTIEACGFRDAKTQYDDADVVLLGISPDGTKAQAKFADKFDLSYSLLADANHATAEAYGVWVEKSMYGRKYMGIERTTFLIDPHGNLSHIFRKVKPAGHAAEVLAALKGEK
jgi:peroxiredoxin Q/BCP